jgi:adenylate cyclase
VLRFSNVSAHHCQMNLSSGYWFVHDLQSRNGVKVNGIRVTDDKRLDPGDILSIAMHKYQVQYSPMDLGAVGPPPQDNVKTDILSKSLLERAGLEQNQFGRSPAQAEPGESVSYDPTKDDPGQLRFRYKPL